MRGVLLIAILLIATLLLLNPPMHAGGPAFVAGTGYFDPTVKGTPVTWPQGVISYFTDQGDLSPTLLGPNADAFVASAFGMWNSVPTAAILMMQSGHLAEDVNGANFSVLSGVIAGPPDITPSATGTAVGVVYDEDGSVTDALLGTGASNFSYCATTSAFGGVDNFDVSAHFQHALIILNGNCAQTPSQLPDFQYHLVRVIGRILGLDWSQANLNVITRNPPPIAGDYSGFPVMHQIDPVSCIPVSTCYSNHGVVSPAQTGRPGCPFASVPDNRAKSGNVSRQTNPFSSYGPCLWKCLLHRCRRPGRPTHAGRERSRAMD